MSKPKKTKYALRKGSYPKTSREFFDIDYIDKLSEKDKAWLNEFLEAYYKNTYGKKYRAKMQEWSSLDNARRRDMWNVFMRMWGEPGKHLDSEDEQ